MYKILGEDGKEYGPASADQVRQWIAEGRVSRQTQMYLEGSPSWKALGEFPEFGPALAAKSGPPALPPPPLPRGQPATGLRPPGHGLAVASVVLGALSLVGCLVFTGLPAIITGCIARNRARAAQDSQGAKLALAGLIMGCVSFAFIPILAGLALPALAKAKDKAQQINCRNHMQQIGLAARMWASDNNEKFPPDFLSMSNELVTPLVLICPADRSKSKVMSWSDFGPDTVSYEYLRPGTSADNPQEIVFLCPIHGTVGLADGSVQQGTPGRRRNQR
ncbi:MAG TPA: DUF4190 domain-containing protein [Verrucomicrobiae bacterium]|nr:DUF4190 domain-containing protein [Verrucomicrobiae bacterium]